MIYASVCDGIGAAHAAWQPLGWRCAWTSEIDPFPSAVVEQRWGFPNLGDMTEITDEQLREHGPVELLVGGTPCQSFSVAGLRKGLADPRGNLALVYLGLVDRIRPRWVVWENVPGVLSSNGGRDFGAFVGGLAELGYGFAYRVLDAAGFGLPQTRKRVFVCGHRAGEWQRAVEVLLEPESGSMDFKPRGTLPTLDANFDKKWGSNQWIKGGFCIADERGARRVTPLEAERAMGFPDDHTAISYCNKPAADGPRYKALGNSMAVNVMSWVGQRIEGVSNA